MISVRFGVATHDPDIATAAEACRAPLASAMLAVTVLAALLMSPIMPAAAQPVSSGPIAGPPGPLLPQAARPDPVQIVPQGSPLPRIVPQQPVAVSPGPLIPPPANTASPMPAASLAVKQVAVEGVTVFPPAEMDRLTAGLVGTTVPLSEIEARRTVILQRYRNGGYPLTAVSAVIDGGTVRFRITEGHIADVKLDGDIGPAGVQVLRFLQRLTEPKAISASTLERYLLLAQDVPGISLRAVLRPSTDEPGALTLVAQVSRQAVSGLLSADNRGFNKSGPEEGLAVLDLNSFTSLGERSEFSLYRTFNSTQIFGQFSEEAYVGASGLRVRIYGGAGDSQPSGQLRATGYDGFTRVFGGQLTYPIIRARQQTLNLVGIFDALESDISTASTSSTGASVSARNSYDSLRMGRVGLEYALSDIVAGGDRPAINGMSIRLTQGIHGLGAKTDQTRAGERVDFFKAVFDVNRTQTLWQPYDGASLSVMGIVTGQVTPNLLPPAEKFYLGGNRIDRGFYAGQVTGDNALAATVELQFTTSNDVTLFGRTATVSPQYYLFYDWGEAWQNQSTDPNGRLRSFGGGVRLNITRFAEFDLEGTKRLTRYPSGNIAGVSELPGEAVFWRTLFRF